MDNSQMLNHATTLAPRKSNMLSATQTTRNASSAKKDHQTATLLPSALPLVESHTPSATQVLESALHATQLKTKIALKSKKLATKNAKSCNSPSATKTPESASPAQEVEKDAFQVLPVNQPAHTNHIQTHTCAHGTPPPHSASKIQRVP